MRQQRFRAPARFAGSALLVLVAFAPALPLASAAGASSGSAAAPLARPNVPVRRSGNGATMSAGSSCVPSVESPVPVAAASQRFHPLLLPPLPSGWVDQEFFVSCSSSHITYKTAVYVRRPANPHRASGNVVVEPLHSGDIFGVLTNVQPYLVANRDVHVGIAANADAVERLVKPANPARYATLHVPATPDAENEILAGVGAVLHQHPDRLVRDIAVKDAILGGWSQTAVQVRDFIGSPSGPMTADGRRSFDGYFPAQAAVGSRPGPIPDVGVPVVELQGERELLETLRIFGSLAYRRPDSATYRLYEVPGMAHVTSEPDDPASGFSLALRCDWPAGASPSTFKQTQVWEMALDNLIAWASKGIPAPHAPRIELEADDKTVVRDANGNALGGVRTVLLDVPVATFVPTSLNPGGVPGNPCAYIGYQLDFGQKKLVQLYRRHSRYVRRFVRDARRLVRERWLLPESARADIVAAARSNVLRSP